jgi:hypothetical protein
MKVVLFNSDGIKYLNEQLKLRLEGFKELNYHFRKNATLTTFKKQAEDSIYTLSQGNGTPYCVLHPWVTISGESELIQFNESMYVIEELV